MKRTDIEALLRDHFKAEVEALRGRQSPDESGFRLALNRTFGANTQARPGSRWALLVAAALLAVFPFVMFVSRPTLAPLANSIDSRWRVRPKRS